MVDVPLFLEALEWVSFFVGAIGVAFIIYGVAKTLVMLVQKEAARKKKSYTLIRLELTEWLVFGLDFLVAEDIIKTFVATANLEDYEQVLDSVIILAVTVLIRVILGYFLTKEAKEFREEPDQFERPPSGEPR